METKENEKGKIVYLYIKADNWKEVEKVIKKLEHDKLIIKHRIL